MTYRITRIADLAAMPWQSGDGSSRELVSADPIEPAWRIAVGSTAAGGTWERLLPSHEALLIGIGGPRTEIHVGGDRHRVSGTRPTSIAPGESIRVDRSGSSHRSEILLLSFASAVVSGSVERVQVSGAYRPGGDAGAVVLLDGTVDVGGSIVGPGEVLHFTGERDDLLADDATLVVATVAAAG